MMPINKSVQSSDRDAIEFGLVSHYDHTTKDIVCIFSHII